MDQVRVGVIGVGVMGQRHCRVYSGLRQVQLTGVCDARPENGRRVAQQYNAPYFDRVEDILAEVDAVSLVTPTPMHFDLAMQCLAQGKHVLVEKPITETLEQAQKLTEAAEMSDLIVQIGHIERFNPVFMELKHVLEDVTMLAVNFRRLSAYEGSNTDVDVVLDLMIHDLDLVLDLIGQMPVSVEAQGLTALSGSIDHATAQLRFASGPLLEITASRVTEQKVRSIEVTALEAYLQGDLLNKSINVHRRTIGEYMNHNQRGVKYRQESIVERIHVPMAEPLLLELQHFIDCIRENKQPLVTARHGRNALELAVTIQQAIYDNIVNFNLISEDAIQRGVAEPSLALSPS